MIRDAARGVFAGDWRGVPTVNCESMRDQGGAKNSRTSWTLRVSTSAASRMDRVLTIIIESTKDHGTGKAAAAGAAGSRACTLRQHRWMRVADS